MRFKESVKTKDDPIWAGAAFGYAGTITVQCPRCGKKFSYPYSVEPGEPIPMPKLCPWCGEGLLEEEKKR